MNYTVEHLGLPSLNPAELKDWYVRTLDAELVFDNGQQPPAYFLRLGGGLMIEIYSATSTQPATANNFLAGWRHLAVRIPSLEAARDELVRRGVKFSESVKPAGGGGRVLFFSDLDGNLLHLVERQADSVFH
jgi:glyoxylase I family protein